MTGHIQIMESGKPVPGPYTQQSRQIWLSKLLTAQVDVRRLSSKPNLTIISLEELQEIRRIWVIDKHELEDSLPRRLDLRRYHVERADEYLDLLTRYGEID